MKEATAIEEEIDRERWEEFCSEFSRQHQGWLVKVGVIETDAKTESMTLANSELWGVTAERKNGTYELAVITGDPSNHTTHLVHHPLRILFERTPDGAHKGLRVDSEEGQITLIVFRVPAFPETLDGIAESER